MHHALCVIQELHEAHDNITCGMHNALKKFISKEGHHQQETRGQHNIIGEVKNYYFNMKLVFFGSHTMV